MIRNLVAAGVPLMMFAMTAVPVQAGNDFLPAPCPYLSEIPTWAISTPAGVDCFIGVDPRAVQTTTLITTPVLPVIVNFLDASGFIVGTTDPTAPLYPNPELTALAGVLRSPIFQNLDFKLGGTDLGSVQWMEATERASFWKLPGASFKNWHVVLTPLPLPAQVVDVPYGFWQQRPDHFWAIDGAFLDAKISEFAAAQNPGTLPIILFYNIGEYSFANPGERVFGYHSEVRMSNGVHRFFVYASWHDSDDIGALTHELAEFAHDPIGNNPVAPWPEAGTFSLPWNPPYTLVKCQGNLEVGDPLGDRNAYPNEQNLLLTNGTMTYTFQNVVTASWLMQAKPSFSVNGWYTLKGPVDGEFAGPAPACPGTGQ